MHEQSITIGIHKSEYIAYIILDDPSNQHKDE